MGVHCSIGWLVWHTACPEIPAFLYGFFIGLQKGFDFLESVKKEDRGGGGAEAEEKEIMGQYIISEKITKKNKFTQYMYCLS